MSLKFVCDNFSQSLFLGFAVRRGKMIDSSTTFLTPVRKETSATVAAHDCWKDENNLLKISRNYAITPPIAKIIPVLSIDENMKFSIVAQYCDYSS